MDRPNDYLLAVFLILVIYAIGKMIDNNQRESKINVSDDGYHKNNISDIENKTTDFKLRESVANQINHVKVLNKSNNVNDTTSNLIAKVHRKIRNHDDARRFVYEQLNYMYVFYDIDDICKKFIDMTGIPKYEFYNSDLEYYDTEAGEIVFDVVSKTSSPEAAKPMMQLIVLSVMKKYNIGNIK